MTYFLFPFIFLISTCAKGNPIVVGFAKPVEPSVTDYPFHVNILQNIAEKEGKYEYWSTCGASLIHPLWVLTAAHCIRTTKSEPPLAPEKTFLAMGSLSRDGKGAQILGASKIIANEKYLDDLESDVAVIGVYYPGFTLNDAVQVIQLQISSKSLIGKTAYLTGFGVINDFLHTPDTLRLGKFKIDKPWKCLDDENEQIHLCAVSWVEGGGKACKGDSGGPLFMQENGIFKQIGITSRLAILPICQMNLNNAIYTKVSAFIDWINYNTGIYDYDYY